MFPRYGTPPRPGIAYRRRPGAYAVLFGADGRVLLTRQETADLREIQLPGGGIERGEAPLPALAREVVEETGHTCRIDRWLATYRRYTFMVEYGFHAEKICHVFVGRAGPRLGPPSEAGHHAIWADLSEAVEMVESKGDRAVLRALAAG